MNFIISGRKLCGSESLGILLEGVAEAFEANLDKKSRIHVKDDDHHEVSQYSPYRGKDGSTLVYWEHIDDNEPKKSYQYSHCKFINARYNCSRFAHTTASSYRLVVKTQTGGCRLPDFNGIIDVMRYRQKYQLKSGLRAIFIGDSHLMQIFQSLLCMFGADARDVEVFETAKNVTNDSSKLLKLHKLRYKHIDDLVSYGCHTIKYIDYPYFYLQPAPGRHGKCQLSHEAGHTACFRIPSMLIPFPNRMNESFPDDAENIQVELERTDSLFCSSYVRPLKDLEAVEAGLKTGIIGRMKASSVKDFDVIVANNYINPTSLANFLLQNDFNGRLLVVPQFGYGNQTSFRFHEHKIFVDDISFLHKNHSRLREEALLMSREVRNFCIVVNSIIKRDSKVCVVLGLYCRN